jgi:uncharacterized YigZ family protein
MCVAPDNFHTIEAPAEGIYKDRGSRFLGFAFPVQTEGDVAACLEGLRKEHFKARHHCFAWRLGVEGVRYRSSDDGEPSGTAGRPILGQIDAAGLTDVVVVVVRYFGGTLLGTSGLIQAYKGAAQEAIGNASVVEKILRQSYCIQVEYAIMPDLMHLLKRLDLPVYDSQFGDHAAVRIAIRRRDAQDTLLRLKAGLLKKANEEAVGLDWPDGVRIRLDEENIQI